MALWQKGDKDEARKWFDKAVAWTKEKDPKNVELPPVLGGSGRAAGPARPGSPKRHCARGGPVRGASLSRSCYLAAGQSRYPVIVVLIR